MKKKVYLDIDGVVADFGTHFLEYLGIEDKTPPTTWDDARFKDNMWRVKDDYNFWLSIPPLLTPEQMLFDFEGYCTSRPIPSSVTLDWLEKNKLPLKPVITVNGSKVNALKEVGCDVFIDDYEENFDELNRNGIKCFLMTRSHNVHVNTSMRIDKIEDFFVHTKTNLLILGHKEHGKTTLAEMICKHTGLTFEDSSMAAARIFIYNALKDKYNYKSFEECFTDRRNHRKEWFDLITEYNREKETRLAREILSGANIYVGMRREEELIASIDEGLFDVIIGIFDPYKALESKESNTADVFQYSDFIIWNNAGLYNLEQKVKTIFNGKY
jgi:hypothetical protein